MIVYFDENMPPHLAKGFGVIQKPENLKKGRSNIEIKTIRDQFGQGAKDLEWIPEIGKENAFVITQDINITRRKDELKAYKDNGVGLFVLRSKGKGKGLTVWEMLIAIAKNWEDLITIMLTHDKAFAYEFKITGKPKKI